MIRILHCVNNMHRAGLETILMNYYRHTDRTKIQFDFLMHRAERSDYDDEIERLGGRIYRAPRLYPQNYPAYFSYMKRFFAEHPEYRIVHSHIDAMSYLPLLAAKKAGVPVRIAHSHSSRIDPDLKYPLKQFFRYRLRDVATHCIGCGQMAGAFLFRGREFQLIPNAIDADRFRYDPQIRARKRRELELGDRLVVGHIGRFTYAKNHEFLLQIFAELLRQEPHAVLLLVGTGENVPKVQTLAESLGISGSVKFLGNRADVSELYQAMDVFALPSHFEGVPVVGIEAQFSGLPCVFSANVSAEVCFTDRCRFLNLEEGASRWAECLLECGKTERVPFAAGNTHYDIRHAAELLQSYYMTLHTS